jgi:hypothetical protein
MLIDKGLLEGGVGNFGKAFVVVVVVVIEQTLM